MAPGGLGKSSLVGPERMFDVATVSITFSPITLGEPKTQKTSAARSLFQDLAATFEITYLIHSTHLRQTPFGSLLQLLLIYKYY